MKHNVLKLFIISLTMLAVACSSSRNTITETQGNEQENQELTDVVENEKEDDSTKQKVISAEVQKEIFDQYLKLYSDRYNTMINEYMTAQKYLVAGNNELARSATLRAVAIMPSIQTYELLVFVLNRLDNKEETDLWTSRLQDLRDLLNDGKFLTPEGEVISIR